MHVAALERYAGHGSVEILVFQFSDFASVHGVGPVGAEKRYVKLVRALADFLIGVESDADFAVLYLGVLFQIGHSRYNFGDAGLVVGAEKRRAVGHDQILADIV